MADEGGLPYVALRELIRERILERILDGTYGPGERIVEYRLTKEFGVSQAPIREALRELEAMRFVESQPHRGARVRSMSRAELSEMYPVRAALEEVAGRAAAPIISEQTLAELDRTLHQMRELARNGDVHGQLRLDARFHELIVGASGNSLLLEMWRSLHVETRTLITVTHAHQDMLSIALAHEAIVRALRLRDPELSGKEMRDHIEHFGALVTDHLPDA